MMKISKFGQKIAKTSGIGQLMEDLGFALTERKDVLMLGGGNPAHIPQVQQYFRKSMVKLLEGKGSFERMIGDYDPPGGNKEFIKAITDLLNREFGWGIKTQNVVLTNGSQTAFFILFNIFAGAFEGGLKKKILLPLTPEYIGYCDVGLEEDLFTANKPEIEHIDEHFFKYHIDFHRLKITDDIGAICVSRPTNPSGNVLTKAELEKLSEIAGTGDIPLIIDNAYGTPFPNIIFTEAEPIWNEHIIVCMSLSKLGLPATRTGIIIAREEVVDMVTKVNAVMSLAPGGIGAAIVTDLVRSGEIIRISQNIIKPFYKEKADEAVELLLKELNGIEFYIHKPEGAIFLWIWFKDLPVSSAELYEVIKKAGVLVVPGHYFFPGFKERWTHRNECIRLNYSQENKTVAKGIKIMAEQVKRAYDKA